MIRAFATFVLALLLACQALAVDGALITQFSADCTAFKSAGTLCYDTTKRQLYVGGVVASGALGNSPVAQGALPQGALLAGSVTRMLWQGVQGSEGAFTTGGTGGSAAFPGATSADPGSWARLTASTGTTDYVRVSTGNLLFYPGGGVAAFSARVKLTALPDGTDTFRVACGLNEYVGITTGSSLFFEVHNGSNFWHTGTTTTPATVVATTTAVAPANWYKLEIETNAAWTSAIFKVNGAAVNTSPITVTPGSTALSPFCGLWKSAGTSARTMDVDWVSFEYFPTVTY